METLVREEQIKQIREQWKRLWQERVDDKVRAEGIAREDFSVLFVDRGTVILATRNFKMLNLRDILDAHGLTDSENKVFPNTAVGGWSKFIRTSIVGQKKDVRECARVSTKTCYTFNSHESRCFSRSIRVGHVPSLVN